MGRAPRVMRPQPPRDLPHATGADRPVVDARHRHRLHPGAGEEDLLGEIDLGAVDRPLDDLDAQVLAQQLHLWAA
jgi:hypothetical protein